MEEALRQRGAVERENGRLKHEWALLPLRVRRLERVQLHAGLTILARLTVALAKARAVPLAAWAALPENHLPENHPPGASLCPGVAQWPDPCSEWATTQGEQPMNHYEPGSAASFAGRIAGPS